MSNPLEYKVLSEPSHIELTHQMNKLADTEGYLFVGGYSTPEGDHCAVMAKYPGEKLYDTSE